MTGGRALLIRDQQQESKPLIQRAFLAWFHIWFLPGRAFERLSALFGAWHAKESGLAFFGADHVLFGTDFRFDPERGPGFIRETIAAMERMRASDLDKAKIYEGNARASSA